MKQLLYKNRCGLTLILMAVLILIPFLGMTPLIDPDEPVYGETAREMLLSGDWLSPHIFGKFWYDKPPLFYWLEMLSYGTWGVSDFTSRLPSSLMAISTVFYVYLQGKDLFNKKIAFIASFLLLTSLGFIYVGRAAITDMTLMLTLTVTMISFYQERYYLAYGFCGLALLSKGPIGYAFPALVMLLYILLCHHWHLIRTMKIPQGILLAFAVGLPWYVFMYHVHGEAFLDTFIGYHNITRFAAPEHPGQNSLFFFIPIFLGAMLPWTALIFPAIHRLMKKRDPFKDTLIFCLIWAAFIFIFFSLSKTQLVTYIAPMFPPTAYIIGWYLYRCYTEKKLPCTGVGISILAGMLLLLCNAIPLNDGAVFFKSAIFWASILLSAAVCIPAAFLYWQKWKKAFASAVLLMTLFTWSAYGLILPTLSDHITSYRSAQILHDVYDGHSELYVEKFIRPGITFYCGLYGTEWEETQNMNFSDLLASPEKTYLIMTRSSYEKTAKTQPVIYQYGIAAEMPTQLILINHP